MVTLATYLVIILLAFLAGVVVWSMMRKRRVTEIGEQDRGRVTDARDRDRPPYA